MEEKKPAQRRPAQLLADHLEGYTHGLSLADALDLIHEASIVFMGRKLREMTTEEHAAYQLEALAKKERDNPTPV